jgi:predicted nucleic acid-binding protein
MTSGGGRKSLRRWGYSAIARTSGMTIPLDGSAHSGRQTRAEWAEALLPVLLDTTVLIDVLRGRPAAARVLNLRKGGQVPWICAINVEEVWRGLRAQEEEGAGGLLDALRLAALGRSEARRAGAWRRQFAQRGTTLSQADCLIASAAVTIGVPLATGNPRDFPMKDLVVEHWPVGG